MQSVSCFNLIGYSGNLAWSFLVDATSSELLQTRWTKVKHVECFGESQRGSSVIVGLCNTQDTQICMLVK